MAFRDIRRSNRLLTPADIGFILGALVLVVALLVLDIHLARTLNGGEWLYLRWSGARAFLFEHIEPYGSVVAQRVQELAYGGRAAFLNEYPYALNDPFYIVLLYTPLALISDFAIARGIWMLLSQAALVGIVLLSLDLSEWKPPLWMLVILMGFGLFSYFSISALLSASPTIFLTLIYLIILSALRSFSDELAGALLFLVAYQWEVGILFFLLVLIFVIMNKRWQVLSGFGMTFILLALISLIANRGWIIPYIRAVLFNWSQGISYTFGITLAYIFSGLSISIDKWISAVVSVVVLVEAIRSADEHARQVMWAAFLSLALNPIAGFAIFLSNHIVLLPAVILVTGLVWERWQDSRVVPIAYLIGLIIFFYIGFYFETLDAPSQLYSELINILPPLLTVIGLYWMRWWVVRPPRIWADQLGARK